jgi:hypothetical protein
MLLLLSRMIRSCLVSLHRKRGNGGGDGGGFGGFSGTRGTFIVRNNTRNTQAAVVEDNNKNKNM